MKEVGSQTPQNNMKCQYKKMKAQTNQERNTEAKVKIMKNDTLNNRGKQKVQRSFKDSERCWLGDKRQIKIKYKEIKTSRQMK